MKQFIQKTVCLLLSVLSLGAYLPQAHAKTVEEWLEGFDTGEVWFGEDFHYDITDEEACWELLQKPITILDAGQREEIYPRQTPDGKKVNNDKLGGFINGASAAVHVLGEDENGWTLIEGIDYYNRVIRGYVRTKLLKTVTPNEKYGVIIDKLTQRLYVFIDGKLWDSCLISTGLPNDEQPYNETAAGEYLICSWVGDFDSEGMICATALRFNGGDMIHEVPHKINYDGTKSYWRWEALLGQKASHGCVRTQRIETEKGLSARWLWDNLKKYTKVVIWDDKGRKMPYPDDGRVLFYNPNGGNYYHADQYCNTVRSKYLPLAEFTYVQLDEVQFLGLDPCTTCQPPRRKSLIAKENLARGAITQEEYLAALTPIPYPDEALELYYNPKGGKYYHATARCSSVKERFLPLTGFAYGELEADGFASLTPCPYCSPVSRKSVIDEQNREMGLDPEAIAAALEDEGEESFVESELAIVVDDLDTEEVSISITDGF
ncbi:MAG: L,D-transpeptidase [Clostridia bacterium]|nr:L,D-transpeptidase [Clostridia bacterium]